MRIRIHHETRYRYDPPARAVVQILRLTPRSHAGQYVRKWRIDLDHDCRLRAGEDALGNITHSFAHDQPTDQLTVTITGEVETVDTAGVVRNTVERFPPTFFVRETPLTRADAAIRALAGEAAAQEQGDPLRTLHRLTARLPELIRFEPGTTSSATGGAEALALGRGVCQDHAHVLLAAARSLQIPTRYVSGHLFRHDGDSVQDAAHAWAEAFVPDLGWVGFDPANGISPTDAHVRVAVGLDYLGAAPVRGTRYGGGGESLEVQVRVEEVQRQGQTASGASGQSQAQTQS